MSGGTATFWHPAIAEVTQSKEELARRSNFISVTGPQRHRLPRGGRSVARKSWKWLSISVGVRIRSTGRVWRRLRRRPFSVKDRLSFGITAADWTAGTVSNDIDPRNMLTRLTAANWQDTWVTGNRLAGHISRKSFQLVEELWGKQACLPYGLQLDG